MSVTATAVDNEYPPLRGLRIGSDLIVESTACGLDYTRICAAHEWASQPAHRAELTGHCPHCEVDMAAGPARKRYRAVLRRLQWS